MFDLKQLATGLKSPRLDEDDTSPRAITRFLLRAYGSKNEVVGWKSLDYRPNGGSVTGNSGMGGKSSVPKSDFGSKSASKSGASH